MVSDEVSVTSHSVDSDKAYRWTSKGADGYTIEECDKEEIGTTITLKIKEDTEEEKYSEFLEPYRIQGIVKKYSDYIRYPIKMDIEHRHLKEGSKDEYESHIEEETLNSMIPIWKKNKKDLKQEEYNQFYQEKFFDYEEPLRTIHTFVEGQCSYLSLIHI